MAVDHHRTARASGNDADVRRERRSQRGVRAHRAPASRKARIWFRRRRYAVQFPGIAAGPSSLEDPSFAPTTKPARVNPVTQKLHCTASRRSTIDCSVAILTSHSLKLKQVMQCQTISIPGARFRHSTLPVLFHLRRIVHPLQPKSQRRDRRVDRDIAVPLRLRLSRHGEDPEEIARFEEETANGRPPL